MTCWGHGCLSRVSSLVLDNQPCAIGGCSAMGSLSSLEHMALLEPALWGAGGIDGVIDVVAGMVYPGAAYPDSRKKMLPLDLPLQASGQTKTK